MLPVGLFDACEGLVFDQQVFIDEKPAYYEFANETESMTGAELFAKYAPPGGLAGLLRRFRARMDRLQRRPWFELARP